MNENPYALPDQLDLDLYGEGDESEIEPEDAFEEGQGIESEIQAAAPDLHRIKWGGEERELSYDDLINHAQMGYDYTQKTSELARQREELGKIAELGELFNQHPDLAEQFGHMLQGYFDNGESQGHQNYNEPQMPQYNIAQDPQFQAMQQKLAQFEQMEQQRQMQNEWDNLKTRFPDAENMFDDIVGLADTRGYDLETAYKLLNYDTIQNRTKEQMVKTQMKKQVSRTQMPGNQPGGKADAPPQPSSYSDIRKLIESQGLLK